MIVTTYTFDASAQTITFGGFTSIDLNRIQLITNATDNVIIFNFAETTLKGTVATNVLTLQYDTTTMDDADKLKIIYEEDNEDGKKVAEQFAPVAEDNVVGVIKVEKRYSYTLATLASLTAIKASAGFVHAFAVGRESCPSFTILDSATGTGSVVYESGPNHPRGSYVLDESFGTGISIIFAGVGQTPSVNLSWR